MIRLVVDCRMIGSGGIGSFISELVPFFLEKNECLLLGNHEQCMPFLRLPNVEFQYCDVKPFSWEEMYSFPKDILEKIHTYDYYFTPYCNIPGGLKIPVYSTIHDIVFLDVPGLTGFMGRLARKHIYQRAINLSQAVFTVSEFSRERILKKLNCKKPLNVIYNSAPSYLSKPLDKSPVKNNSILFVGNIKKHKGLKTLLDAFEILQSKGSNLTLQIVGNPDNFRTGDEETVERLSKMEPSKVQFTGRISNEELKDIYASSTVLVQPSLYEGFGMPPLEAMTLGTPAIISDIQVFKEIYGDFPVTFFKTGDSEDLAEKLLLCEKSPSKIELGELKNKYSYKKSANLIIDIISNYSS